MINISAHCSFLLSVWRFITASERTCTACNKCVSYFCSVIIERCCIFLKEHFLLMLRLENSRKHYGDCLFVYCFSFFVINVFSAETKQTIILRMHKNHFAVIVTDQSSWTVQLETKKTKTKQKRKKKKKTHTNLNDKKRFDMTQRKLRSTCAWSESVMSAWGNFASFTIQNAPSDDSGQTSRMRSLIWIFAGRTCPKIRFMTLRLIELYNIKTLQKKKKKKKKKIMLK